jgi:alpha-glucosidase (family GH31 glycosyl hydrolase)
MGRAGWAVVDDSDSLVFNDARWLEPRRRPGALDLYFFGYGHDYGGCLRDFYVVAGRPSLLPRWALGNWWSRFYSYTQTELTELMTEFEANGVPLSVCIVDMDWHITDTGNESSGWTGYTWNRALFPDPQGFIRWLHARGLKTALNLHPADGVHAHEAQYEQMTNALGLDPASQEPIAFDIGDPEFMRAYFELLHHPHEADGVDFWWIDWQQGTRSKVEGLDPLWFLNHLHFHDLGRAAGKRPFIFSRWGGLGNHRYPIGFSGDTLVTWEALAFQPHFTATASNVGYGWWSHDIGGHMGGVEDDELYTRWVQFGTFSPILRLHSTKNAFQERRPWRRGREAAQAASEAMRLRHRLIPYLYSMAWRDHTRAAPLIQPMYYSHPERNEAYQCGQQYWFGSELIAAPFTTPAEADTRLSKQTVWLPPGTWFDFFSGERVTSNGWRAAYGGLADIPVYARAGAIVPLGPATGVAVPAALTIHIFPGADNRFELYEDDGETQAYTQGRYALTAFAQEQRGDELRFTISPALGDVSALPAQREYQLVVYGLAEPSNVAVEINGAVHTPATEYDSARGTLTLSGLSLRPSDTSSFTLYASPFTRDHRAGHVLRLLRAFHLDSWLKQRLADDLPKLLSGELTVRGYAGLKDAHLAALESVLQRPQ